MPVHFEFTRKDMRALEIFLMKQNTIIMIFGLFSIVMLIWATALNLFKHHSVYGYWGLGAVVLLAVFIISRLGKNGKLKLYGVWTILLNDNGMRLAPPNGNEAFIPWQNLHSAYLTKRYIFILTNKVTGIAIAKRSLSPDSQAALAGCIRKNEPLIGSNLPTRWGKRGYPLFPVIFLAVLGTIVLANYLAHL